MQPPPKPPLTPRLIAPFVDVLGLPHNKITSVHTPFTTIRPLNYTFLVQNVHPWPPHRSLVARRIDIPAQVQFLNIAPCEQGRAGVVRLLGAIQFAPSPRAFDYFAQLAFAFDRSPFMAHGRSDWE